MNWLNVVIIVLEILIIGGLLFYKTYITEFVKFLYARGKSYEAEKGKHEALYDSMQSILKEVEHMKSAISLEEKRKHNWIESRNQKLINLIRYSETINTSKARFITALNNESKTELERLLEEISSTIVNLRVDSLTLLATNPEIEDDSVTTFTDAVFLLGNELLVTISNALSILESYEKMLNHATTLQNGQEKLLLLEKAESQRKILFEMKNNTKYRSEEGYEDKMTKYFIYLREIFGKGTVLKADIDSSK